MELKGRTALITGSCSEGMGRSAAFRLAREGANIALNFGTHRRDAEARAKADKVAGAVKALGGEAMVCEADTTREDEVAGMVQAAQDAFGAVDILVNNAGGDWLPMELTEISAEQWRAVLAAEIDATFFLLKHVLPGMRERQWGRIVHISMDGATLLQTMSQRGADYCLGKAARTWMTTAWGLQEFPRGVTVNCVEPGLTEQMSFEDALAAARGGDTAWRQREKSQAHDIAEAVAYLCSGAARFVSGSVIRLPTDMGVVPY